MDEPQWTILESSPADQPTYTRYLTYQQLFVVILMVLADRY